MLNRELVGIPIDMYREHEKEEIEKLLIINEVPENVIDRVISTIDGVYTQLEESYTSARYYEAFIRDKYGDRAEADFDRVLTGKKRPGRHLRYEMKVDEAKKLIKHMDWKH